MDLIERYLHAVKGHLPAAQQDAAAELEDDLRSRVADREQELGRPLTEDEVAAMLRSLGRPMVFAARYHGHQPLIGAAMMPYYLLTLKVGAGIALLVNVVVAVVLLALGTPVGESLKGVFVFPFTTLPIQIYSMVRSGITPEINAVSTLLLVATALLLLAAHQLERGQVSPGEIFGRPAVHDGTHKHG